MKNSVYILIISLAALAVFSCEKTVEDIDLPEVEEAMVVYSFISPGNDTVYVEITRSEPYFGQDQYYTEHEHVTDADVHFIYGGTKKKLQYDDLAKVYFLPVSGFKIEPGKTYKIEAEAPGLDVIYSECTVPAATPTDLKYEGQDYFYEYGEQIRMKFSFTDIPNMKNYYRVIVYKADVYQNDTAWTQDGWNLGNVVTLLTDQNKDGHKLTFTHSQFIYQDTTDIYRVNLLSVDENYYNFYDKLNKIYNNGDNPFSEPVIPYSNIENGLGVFASSTSYSRTFTITYDPPDDIK